jgi:hypothetical protein
LTVEIESPAAADGEVTLVPLPPKLSLVAVREMAL